MTQVAIFIGSASDDPIVGACAKVLKQLGISYRYTITSAHRTPEEARQFALTAREQGLSLVILMLTDVLLEGSQIVYLGDDETIQQAFNINPKDNTVFLPHIMSRKKQVIPMLSALWG